MSEVLSIGTWRNNAEMIADVARLGYLDGTVLDATYGEGGFWTYWRPEQLTASDLHKSRDASDGGSTPFFVHAWDYRSMPVDDGSFDVVVFDPPYKLNGTPALGEQDERFGTTGRTSRQEVLDDIVAGAVECFRVCARRLIVKVMDQVEGGRKRWQTDLVTQAVEDRCACGHGRTEHLEDHCWGTTGCPCDTFRGGRKIDRFDIGTAGRSQPGNRTQRTSRSHHSTLLVFEKPTKR